MVKWSIDIINLPLSFFFFCAILNTQRIKKSVDFHNLQERNSRENRDQISEEVAQESLLARGGLKPSANSVMFLQRIFHPKTSCWTKTFPTPWYSFNRPISLINQFRVIKKQFKKYILLFQVGDFYEVYGDDASKIFLC